MNCPRCGAVVEANWTHCTCGQYLPRVRPEMDLPSEFYQRIETQVEKSGKDNFRRGLLLGLGFLALFLLLETIMDTVFIARGLFIGVVMLAAAVVLGINLWLLVRKFFIQQQL